MTRKKSVTNFKKGKRFTSDSFSYTEMVTIFGKQIASAILKYRFLETPSSFIGPVVEISRIDKKNKTITVTFK